LKTPLLNGGSKGVLVGVCYNEEKPLKGVSAMKNRDEVLSLLRDIKPQLKTKWGVEQLALFGSVARAEHTLNSDVDLLIEFKEPLTWDYFDLIDALEALLESKVDLVSRKQIKPKAWQYIKDEVIDV
jgi:predicted nucleotidyltransferase